MRNLHTDKSNNKSHDLDRYVTFSLICLIIFTAMVSVFQFMYPDSQFSVVLITCFFAAFGGETLLCARIKKYKLHKEIELAKSLKEEEIVDE